MVWLAPGITRTSPAPPDSVRGEFFRIGKPIDLSNGGIGGTQIDAHDSTWLDWKSDLRLPRGDQHECVHKVI